jgi:hypothetical protein
VASPPLPGEGEAAIAEAKQVAFGVVDERGVGVPHRAHEHLRAVEGFGRPPAPIAVAQVPDERRLLRRVHPWMIRARRRFPMRGFNLAPLESYGVPALLMFGIRPAGLRIK